MSAAGQPPASALAIWAASRWHEETGIEFLRIVVGLVATGREVQLVEAGEGHGALGGAGASDDAESYLEALADAGVHPVGVDEASLVHAAGAATTIVRVSEPDREGVPDVLVVSGAPIDEATLLGAGQVLRTRA